MDLPLVQGYNGLFVCMDKFSKYCQLVPIFVGEGELSARQVAQLFFDAVVQLLGIPRSVLHDRDVRFTAPFWTSLWSILSTWVLLSSAYHPQTNGQTEHWNWTVEQVVFCLSHEGVDDWVCALPLGELAINNSVNDSTGLSTAHIVYG